MLRKFHLIFLLICAIKCERSLSNSVENLYTILDQTSEYFKNLSNAYKVSNIDVSNNIDSVINKYVENTTKVILQRQRRSVQNLQSNKDVKVLQDFVETLSINIPDLQDIAFISIQDEQHLLWFAAAIGSSKILLYQLVNNAVELAGTYLQLNGKRIVVNNYSNSMLIVVQTNTDEIVVVHLSKNINGVYEFHFKQEFEIPGVLHMSMWFGMNQVYLGVATDTRVFIYVWLGQQFDRIYTYNFGATKLLSFQSKSFMHVVVVGSFSTRILQFSVRLNKFVEIQKLRGARDVNWFHFKKGYFEEHFLVLADDSSTIFYKEMYDRFSPFQRVETSTKYIYSLTMENTVVLLFANEDTVEVYQYNGWRFVKLNTMLSNIRRIHQVRSYGDDTVIVQRQDGEWKFLKPIWTVKKTWQSMQKEIQTWCSETKQKISQRTLENIPGLKDPVKISNAHIGELRAQNINGRDATELIRLTQQYKKTVNKLNLAKSILAKETSAKKSKYTVLHGNRLAIKCKTKCYVSHLHTDVEIKPAKFKALESNQTLEFATLKVKELNNWKCPIPNVRIDDIFVKGTVNGILMQDLLEKTLKVSGDQEITGEHTFVNLYATNVSMPLEIATKSTKQSVLMKEVRVKDLHLTEDFFLPLNGNTTTMNGSITAANVRVTGLVNLRGGLKGEAFEKLAYLKDITTPLTLPNDCYLQNVTFRNLVKVKDIVRPRGFSLKEILKNSVPLNSNISQHLIFSSNKTQWNNVNLWDYKDRWVTKHSSEIVRITGTKFASNNISLTTKSYASLPIPKLTIPLCATEVITQEIRTSTIIIDNLYVKNLSVAQVFGADNLNNIIVDSVSALQDVDFSKKRFTGRVYVKNITALEIKGTDIKDFKIQMNDWINVNYIKGPISIAKLVVNDLETPAIFNLSLPQEVNNVIITADSNITNINGINMLSFMENAVKVDDTISLEYVTFTQGFTSNHVYASDSTLNLSQLDPHPNLHSKRISGNLETNAINVPQTFGYVPNDKPSTFIIHGTARFLQEPTVQNINDVNLKKLSEDLWMSNQDTVLSGSMNFKNITIEGDVTIYDYPNNSLSTHMWLDLSDRLLSKTKEQNITVTASFKNVEVPAIIAAKDSVIKSSDPNLNYMLTNSLMKNRTQVVDATWHFEKLDIDNLYWDGKLNGIDLETDIVRHDAKQNIITGRKMIANMMTKDLWLLDRSFSNWANNAVTQRCRKLTTIKGRKTFKNIFLHDLSIKGTIMGRNVNEALLKSKDQTVIGTKKIRGHLNISSLITDSTVNDVTLTNLINNQVKKHKARQIIETKMEFKNNLEVLGNITIGGRYEGRDLINISDHNKLEEAVLNRTTKMMELSEEIKIALRNRSVYVSKFEEVNESTLGTTLISDTENVIIFNSTCLCESTITSMHCNDTKLLNILSGTNSSTLLMIKLVLLDDDVFVIIVSSDYVSIYEYATTEEEFYQIAGLYVPDVHQASVEPADNSLWIVLGLPGETLVLHYQVWDEYVQTYVLPASDTFVTGKTPTNQHLLIRSDGVWSLDGLFQPQHIFKMSLNGKIKAFALGADYYIKVTTKNSTAVFKARYMGN